MKRPVFTFAGIFLAAGTVAAIAYGVNSQATSENSPLAPFEFHREGADSPEVAAKMLFRGVAGESPKHFVQHLLLGVCDGSIDTLQKFAESLHVTEFTHEQESFTFYELREIRAGIGSKEDLRVLGIEPFDSKDPQVKALHFQMLSTYYGETFTAVDVAANGHDGREYQTRIVVAQLGDRWYAIPRCRSANSFYEIADAMPNRSIKVAPAS